MIKNTYVQRLTVTEVKMIRLMCGYIGFDRIRNEVIIKKVKVASIEDKTREARLI